MNRPLMALFALGCAAAVILVASRALLSSSIEPSVPVARTPAFTKPAVKSPIIAPEVPKPLKPGTTQEMLKQRWILDKTVWAEEGMAQGYEDTFVRLWDSMRARVGDRHVVLTHFPFHDLTVRAFSAPAAHPWDVGVRTMEGSAILLDQSRWMGLVDGFVAAGYQLEYSEWHHAKFDIDEHGARSTVNMKLFLTNQALKQRLVVAGPLGIIWSDRTDSGNHHLVRSIDATNLTLTCRTGDLGFVDAYKISPTDLNCSPDSSVNPVLVYDLDGDGRDDIILPSLNAVLWNHSSPGNLSFERGILCDHPAAPPGATEPGILGAVLADFNNDGKVDLVVVGPGLPPTLYLADRNGNFTGQGTVIGGIPPTDLHLPGCITVADVNGDGLLDLWIGQHRLPYLDGNLPDPYWNALDGYPSYLLINHGNGTFTDETIARGLGAKRTRRNYSASFVDLNSTGSPDLITVNDFAGVDYYHNDGRGFFTDTSDTSIDERSSFGMSHAIADFNGDGRLDVFVSGMGSTTARRLEYMKLGRSEFPDHQKYRMKMGYGNRLYLGGEDHHLHQAPFNNQISRTGWSWGCSALDVANDGNMDLYVANGNISRKSAKDYCTRYWTQDIYMADSKPNPQLMGVFEAENSTFFPGWSWNCFEHKALLMNEGGSTFRDVAYPLNVGFEWDSRQVVSADFDGDGRVDLLVVERKDDQNYLPNLPIIHILLNQVTTANHWIEVRLPDQIGTSSQGATITVEAGGRKHPAVIVTGDSFRCQHPTIKHFGLGSLNHVDAVEVRWSDGSVTRVESPAIDKTLIVGHTR